MTALARFAKSVGMTDEAWQRHANPWSVYTRFAVIPAGILAISIGSEASAQPIQVGSS